MRSSTGRLKPCSVKSAYFCQGRENTKPPKHRFLRSLHGPSNPGPRCVDRTYQGEDLYCGQTVDCYLLEAGDDARARHSFTLSHPEHPLIGQHQVTGHAQHHLSELRDKRERKCDSGWAPLRHENIAHYRLRSGTAACISNKLDGNIRRQHVKPHLVCSHGRRMASVDWKHISSTLLPSGTFKLL